MLTDTDVMHVYIIAYLEFLILCLGIIVQEKFCTYENDFEIWRCTYLGVTHCVSILNHLYKPEGDKAQEMEPRFEAFLRLNCPKWSLTSNLTFVLNDPTTFIFDNLYYMNAMGGRGVLRIDVEMVLDP